MCPATCSIVDRVQLLQQSRGIWQTVVSLHYTLHQFTVSTIQQFRVLLKLRGQLEGDKREQELNITCFTLYTVSSRVINNAKKDMHTQLPVATTLGSSEAAPLPERS